MRMFLVAVLVAGCAGQALAQTGFNWVCAWAERDYPDHLGRHIAWAEKCNTRSADWAVVARQRLEDQVRRRYWSCADLNEIAVQFRARQSEDERQARVAWEMRPEAICRPDVVGTHERQVSELDHLVRQGLPVR